MRLTEFKIPGTAEHVRSASFLTGLKTSPKYSFELTLLLLIITKKNNNSNYYYYIIIIVIIIIIIIFFF